MSLVLSFMYIG